MKIGIAHTKDGPKHEHLFRCISEGIKANGDEPVDVYNTFEVNEKLKDCEACFMFSMPFIAHKHKDYYGFINSGEINIPYQNFRLAVFEWAKNSKKRFLPVDSGSLAFDRKAQDTYYQVGYDGIKNKGAYYNRPAPYDRFSSFPLEIKPWVNGERIVVHGQVRFGPGSQHIDFSDWLNNKLVELRQTYPEKEIVFLPHPNSNIKPTGVPYLNSLKESFENCYLSVTFNSNVAINCLVNGIPTICDSDTSIAFPEYYQERTLPSFPERYEFFNKIAFTEWHTNEIHSGEMWRHLRPHIHD